MATHKRRFTLNRQYLSGSAVQITADIVITAADDTPQNQVDSMLYYELQDILGDLGEKDYKVTP
jgi:hypothetical protein